MLCTLAAVPAVAACGSAADPPSTGIGGDDAGDDGAGEAASGDDAAPSNCPGAGNVGPASALPAGTYKRSSSGGRPIIVGADANGIYAFSAVCTHSGCTVSLRSAGASYCPCHGATFDANGNVTRGPASRPLVNYLTTICNGDVYVDVTQTVAEGTRVTG